MAAKAAAFGADLMRFVEKSVLLQTLDAVWKEHLLVLDQLRQGIHLRSYGQRDPLNEYKSEAFALFNAMLDDLKQRVTSTVTGLELQAEPPPMPRTAGDPVREPSGGGAGGARVHHGGGGHGGGGHAARPGRSSWWRTTRRPGATRRATRRARAGRGRSTSTAMAGRCK